MDTQWGRIIFEPGEKIFREGEPGTMAYLIDTGVVEISVLQRGQDVPIATLKDGDLFGEMALIRHFPRSASASAVTRCTVVPISQALLDSIGERVDPLFSHLLRVVVERYREAHLFRLRESGQVVEAPPLPQDESELEGQRLVDSLSTRLKLAQDIQVGIENHEYEVYYQPVIDLSDASVAGFEALIRWRRPTEGLVPPGRFIPMAEETGAIAPIGRLVIDHASRALIEFQSLQDQGPAPSRPLFMAINLSARQFREMGELENIAHMLSESGAALKHVKLEITESMLMDDFDIAVLALDKFKRMGLQLAIDDFGTGYSSLSYLQRFPLDTLKIDRSFVVAMSDSRESARIVRAIAGLAKDLGMNIVAEGIETEEQRRQIADLGCDYGQGYLFSKPLPKQAALDYLTRT